MNRFRPGRHGSTTSQNSDGEDPVAINTLANGDKDPATKSPEDGLNADVLNDTVPDQNVQGGVQDIEAVTLAWSRKSLLGVFIAIWFVYLLNAFQSSTIGGFMPYVTSTWEAHSLLTVIDVVSSSMTAAVFIPLAKFLDLYGRAEGFLLMVLLSELGLILMAVSKNLATYCAAYVSTSMPLPTKEFCKILIKRINRCSIRLASPVSSTPSTSSRPIPPS
jgi:hypothetical protein